MDKLSIAERIDLLRCAGYNPIHLWYNVYLIRYLPKKSLQWPIYIIRNFKN